MKDIEKLLAILAEMGVEQEKLDAAVAALSEEEAPVEPAEGEGEEPSTTDEPPVEEEPAPAEETPVEENPVDVPNPEEHPPVEEEAVVPPEEELPPAAEEIPAEKPPVPELPPVVSLEEFNQVKSELEELKKAHEGLKANYEAMFEALKSAGVVDGNQVSAVGQDEPSAPGRNNVDTTMDDILAEINRKAY